MNFVCMNLSNTRQIIGGSLKRKPPLPITLLPFLCQYTPKVNKFASCLGVLLPKKGAVILERPISESVREAEKT